MESQCEHCDSINFKDEAVAGEFTSCCNKGLVILPALKEVPQKIKALFNGLEFFFNIELLK